jgi:hypothetical protein
MWKYLNESVQGTSHQQLRIVCQDASFVTPYVVDGTEVLILVCSDGAGSAKEAQAGSCLACAAAAKCVIDFFESGHPTSDLSEDIGRAWVRDVHASLRKHAHDRSIAVREFACTLLLAVVAPDRAAFAQIGDGAIVIQGDAQFDTVFWPQSGEYQNTTYFVTDEAYENSCACKTIDRRIDEIALFTDGLQMLALNYANRTVHEPFFKSMLAALRSVPDRQDLIVPMRQFLDSPNVNGRTDDDKTLILATRVAGGDATL